MCMIEDADPCDVYQQVTRRAAKAHRCEECRRTIDKGESHRYVTMLYDRHWSSFRICRHCVVAAMWLDWVCGGYLIGGLSEELAEHWNEDPLYRSHWLGRAMLGVSRGWKGMDPLPDPLPLLRRRGLALTSAA